MTTEYYLYETSENERWDTIANKFYGNCYEITSLIEANFHVPISAVLDAGTELRIPKKNTAAGKTVDWKEE